MACSRNRFVAMVYGVYDEEGTALLVGSIEPLEAGQVAQSETSFNMSVNGQQVREQAASVPGEDDVSAEPEGRRYEIPEKGQAAAQAGYLVLDARPRPNGMMSSSSFGPPIAILDLPLGRVRIKVESPGHVVYESWLDVREDEDVPFDVELIYLVHED